MKRNLLSFALLLTIFAYSAIYSQITITKDDISGYYAPGKVIASYAHTDLIEINIGNAGGGNIWDFSSLNSKLISTATVKEPSSTPFQSDFPDANLVLYLTSFGEDDTSGFFIPDVWSFNLIGDNLFVLGSGGKGRIMGVDIASKTLNTPAYVYLKLPLSYGQKWTQTYSERIENEFGSLKTYSTGQTTVSTVVDAYGVMKMPGGYSVEALRIKRNLRGYTSSDNGQSSERRVYEYVFQGKNGDMVNISALDSLPPAGNILKTGEVVWTKNTTTGVSQRDLTPSEFSLSQNYPNPFNPETILEYSIPEETYVDVRVFDILGKEISLLVSRTEKPGTYKINFDGRLLPSGIYILHMKAGNFNALRKMTLIK